MIAEAALPPRGIIGNARRRLGAGDDPFGLGDKARSRLHVARDALGIQLVRVLVDREVEGAVEAREVHVGLHLCSVLWLAGLDPLGLQFGEGLGGMRLEFAGVPGGGGFGQADGHGVHAAAEVAGGIAQGPLPAGLRVEVEHCDADAPQIGDEAGLCQIAGVEEAKQPPRVSSSSGPSPRIPDGAVARPADQGRADMRAPPVILRRLIGGVDGGDGGRDDFRERWHRIEAAILLRDWRRKGRGDWPGKRGAPARLRHRFHGMAAGRAAAGGAEATGAAAGRVVGGGAGAWPLAASKPLMTFRSDFAT